MWKDKIRLLRDYIIEHGKVAFPVIVIAAVAFTVVLALNAGNADAMANEPESTEDSTAAGSDGTPEELLTRVVPDAPMVENTNPALYTLVATYYNALANGDVETIRSIKNYVKDTEEIKIQELSKYIVSYPFLEIYTKQGPEGNSYIAYVYSKVTFNGYEEQLPGMQAFYVCTDENGELYINDEGDVPEDIIEYFKEINSQDDVLELQNRINVECSDIYLNNIELFDYVNELEREVSKATGEILAAQIMETGSGESAGGEAASEEGTDGSGGEAPVDQQVPVQEGPVYAKTTTTVNVRSSDSEQAEKVNKVAGGSKVQVLEQKANGWSKIQYENKEGYIKSEYLQVEGAALGGEVIGSVSAISNVNIRSSASETAEKIGIVAGGDSVDLISKENGWCKIQYNGLVGYVKEEFVQ